MCGIAGMLCRAGAPPAIAALRAMAAALRHRGPDAAGVFRDARCGLAHTRLAIIDAAGGQQPMADAAGGAKPAGPVPWLRSLAGSTGGARAIRSRIRDDHAV